ncbi:4501_t:CDS:2, partial [Cetraspora pellucida]
MDVNHSNSFIILENVFGLIGTVLRSIQLVPQGLSSGTLIIWASSGMFAGIYAVAIQLSIPLMIQPQMFSIATWFCLIQSLYYDHPYFIGKKAANEKNIKWPETVSGILPIILCFTGYIPQFYQIYCEKIVHGISFLFLAMDIFINSLYTISLAFRPPPFEVLASLLYLFVVTLDLLIIFLYYLLNWINDNL